MLLITRKSWKVNVYLLQVFMLISCPTKLTLSTKWI